MLGAVGQQGFYTFPADLLLTDALMQSGGITPKSDLDRIEVKRGTREIITEDEAREALAQLDPLWDELFPAEQARIVHLLVERVDVRMNGVEVRLRPNGLTGLVREVAGNRRAAA